MRSRPTALASRSADATRSEPARAADAISGEHAVQAVPIVGDVSKGAEEAERVVAEATAALGDLAGMAVTTGLSRAHHPGGRDRRDLGGGRPRRADERRAHGESGAAAARRAGSGTIVTTSAYSIHAPHANRMPYVALKGAIAVFTKNVAKSYGRAGVRANCVCPGAIETAGLAALRTQLATARGVPEDGVLEQVMVDEWHMDVALGRPGRPEEVGELFAFLLSPRAGYLTGATINIDGGTDF